MKCFILILITVLALGINAVMAEPLSQSAAEKPKKHMGKQVPDHTVALNNKTPRSNYKNKKVNALTAAYIYYFTKFVRWPEAVDIKNICVMGGDDSLLDEFKKVASKPVSHIALQVITSEDFTRSAPDYAIIDYCHLLYVTDEYHGVFLKDPLLNFTGLLVVDEFVPKKHAVIRLVMHGNKLSFEISRGNAKKQKLYVSAKLLSLAKAVVE